MFNLQGENGFTAVEFLLLSVFILTLSVIGLVSFRSTMDESREAEVKTNIHTIQTAIERYEVDTHRYPSFLLGGDSEGWHQWHQRYDDPHPVVDSPSNNLVQDVLVQYGYIASYPSNPFVSDGMKVIQSTSAIPTGPNNRYQPGDGDPRFGFQGTTMGNGLSDPHYYKHRTQGIPPVDTPLIETSRTINQYTEKQLGFYQPPDGLHYMMGGRKSIDNDGDVITVASWWPGNFFYRGLFEVRKG